MNLYRPTVLKSYRRGSKNKPLIRVSAESTVGGKLPVTCLIRAMGLREDGDILDTFGGDPTIRATLETLLHVILGRLVHAEIDKAQLQVYHSKLTTV